MIAFGLLVALALPEAKAQEAKARDATSPPPSSRQRPERLDHRHQFGLSVLPGIGYRVIVPYEEAKDCGDSSGDSGKRVCTSGVPFFLDLQASFGLTGRIDLITDLRLGVAKGDIAGVGHQIAFAPGLRVWLDQDVRLKFFTTIQALLDNTKQGQDIKRLDYGIRNSNGLMYDPIRNVGFYVQFGETIGFRRWFRIELDMGFGVQVRMP